MNDIRLTGGSVATAENASPVRLMRKSSYPASILSNTSMQRASSQPGIMPRTSPSPRFNPPRSHPVPVEPIPSLGQSNRTSQPPRVERNYAENEEKEEENVSTMDLDGFLLSALANPQDRRLMLMLDQDIVHFMQDSSRRRLEFPSMNAYQRLIVHRVAQYFRLAHVVDSSKGCVILYKEQDSPVLRFGDLLEQEDEDNSGRKSSSVSIDQGELAEMKEAPAVPSFKIMRRSMAGPNANRSKESSSNAGDSDTAGVKRLLTLEERENAYQRARERIFADMQEQNLEECTTSSDIGKEDLKTGAIIGNATTPSISAVSTTRATSPARSITSSVTSESSRFSSLTGGAIHRGRPPGGAATLISTDKTVRIVVAETDDSRTEISVNAGETQSARGYSPARSVASSTMTASTTSSRRRKVRRGGRRKNKMAPETDTIDVSEAVDDENEDVHSVKAEEAPWTKPAENDDAFQQRFPPDFDRRMPARMMSEPGFHGHSIYPYGWPSQPPQPYAMNTPEGVSVVWDGQGWRAVPNHPPSFYPMLPPGGGYPTPTSVPPHGLPGPLPFASQLQGPVPGWMSSGHTDVACQKQGMRVQQVRSSVEKRDAHSDEDDVVLPSGPSKKGVFSYAAALSKGIDASSGESITLSTDNAFAATAERENPETKDMAGTEGFSDSQNTPMVQADPFADLEHTLSHESKSEFTEKTTPAWTIPSSDAKMDRLYDPRLPAYANTYGNVSLVPNAFSPPTYPLMGTASPFGVPYPMQHTGNPHMPDGYGNLYQQPSIHSMTAPSHPPPMQYSLSTPLNTSRSRSTGRTKELFDPNAPKATSSSRSKNRSRDGRSSTNATPPSGQNSVPPIPTAKALERSTTTTSSASQLPNPTPVAKSKSSPSPSGASAGQAVRRNQGDPGLLFNYSNQVYEGVRAGYKPQEPLHILEAHPLNPSDALSDIRVANASIKIIPPSEDRPRGQVLVIFKNAQYANMALESDTGQGRFKLQRIRAVIKMTKEVPALIRGPDGHRKPAV